MKEAIISEEYTGWKYAVIVKCGSSYLLHTMTRLEQIEEYERGIIEGGGEVLQRYEKINIEKARPKLNEAVKKLREEILIPLEYVLIQ